MRWVLVVAFVLPMLAVGGAGLAGAQAVTCASFPDQAAAQAYLRANPGAAADLNQSGGDPNGIACEQAISDGTYPAGAPTDLNPVPPGQAAPAPADQTPPADQAPPADANAAPAENTGNAGAATPKDVTAEDIASGAIPCKMVAVAGRAVSAIGCEGIGNFGGFLPEGTPKTVWGSNGDMIAIAYPTLETGQRGAVNPPPVGKPARTATANAGKSGTQASAQSADPAPKAKKAKKHRKRAAAVGT